MAKLNLLLDETAEKQNYFSAEAISKAVCGVLKQRSRYAIEVSFVSGEEIKKINNEQRGIDKVTDVLSFPMLDGIRGKSVKIADFPLDYDEELGAIFMGSIVICLKRAKEQAEEYGHSEKREINYLLVHGILHLFGYDHMTDEDKAQMRDLEEKIMAKLNLTRDI